MSSTTAETAILSQAVAARPRDERRVSLLTLCLLALGVGILTGIGAVALRMLIGLIHNVMINGVFKIAYDANILEGASRWGNWVILSPILGGLGRRLSGRSLRAGGERPWGSRGDGRRLL